jgi:hypothetical protein
VPLTRAKAIHTLHSITFCIIEQPETRPTIVFSSDGINHVIAIQKLKDFEGSLKRF